MKGDPRFDSERAWAIGQLEDVEAPDKEAELIMRMLEQWWDDQLRPGNDPWRALGWFEQLARGKALEPVAQQDERFEWVQAHPGWVTRGEIVRVRLDAYQGAAGKAHNGRSGRVVAIRGGDVHVMYDDGRERLDIAARHSPHALEKRIQAH